MAQHLPSRRRLLQVGLGGSALLVLGGLGLGLSPSRLRTPSGPLRVLDVKAWSVLAAVADRLCAGANGAPTATEIGVADMVDDYLSGLHPDNGKDIGRLLGLLESGLSGFLLEGRTKAFTACSPEEQDRVLERWRTGRSFQRMAYKILLGLCLMHYWTDPRVFSQMGYPGPANYGNLEGGP